MASRTQYLVLAIALMCMGHAMGDSALEKQKCIGLLTGLTSCLPYHGGNAKAPTSECCSGLIEAIKNKKKCTCIVLKDRDDPDLGLNINITLALGLPSLCEAPANFSQCLALLHLDPKSSEAQAFNQLGHSSNSPSAEGSSGNGKKQGIDETATKQNGAS